MTGMAQHRNRAGGEQAADALVAALASPPQLLECELELVLAGEAASFLNMRTAPR